MADALATYYVRIAPSASGLGGSLVDELGDAGGKGGSSFLSGFRKIVSVAAVGKVISDALSAGGELEQMMGGAELMFGDAYDYIADKASKAYSTVQMSANDYLKQVNGFATGLKTALGGNEQAAAELADKILVAEADIVAATGQSQEAVQNAFNGIMRGNYTMLDNLQLGITPTKEGFQQVIDKVNEWNATQGIATQYQMGNYADMEAALVDYVAMVGMSGYASEEAAGTLQGSTSMMKAAWENLLAYIVVGSPEAGDAADAFIDTVMAALENFGPALENIVKKVPDIIVKVINKFVENLPKIIKMGGDIIISLVKGLLNAIPELVRNIPEILDAMADAFGQFFTTIKDIGKQIVSGLWEGIKSAKDWLWGKVKDFGSGLVNGVKDFFGIHSPSTLFRDEIGKNLAMGIGEGFEKYMPIDEMQGALNNLDTQLAYSVSTSAYGDGALGSTNYGGVAINVYAGDGQSAREIAEEVMDIIQTGINQNKRVFA